MKWSAKSNLNIEQYLCCVQLKSTAKSRVRLTWHTNFIVMFWSSSLNPLTAVSRRAGYTFFVTMYREPAGRLEWYMQIRPVSRRAGYTHRPSRKQNIFCNDIYGCTINRIYKKTLQYVYIGFSVGPRWATNYFSNVKSKAVASDSRKVNGAQCRQSWRRS